jgi:hypothetical protein
VTVFVTWHMQPVTEVSQAASSFPVVCNAIVQALVRQLLRDVRSGPERGRAPVSLRSRPLLGRPLSLCQSASVALLGTHSKPAIQHCEGRPSAETVVPRSTPRLQTPVLRCPAVADGVAVLEPVERPESDIQPTPCPPSAHGEPPLVLG